MYISIKQFYYKHNLEYFLNISIDKYLMIENEILSILNGYVKNYDYYLYQPNIIIWVGIYYQFEKPNNRLMLKYYKLAIDRGNLDAILCLGLYYCYKKEFELMEKYLLMLENNNYPKAMCILADYYFRNKNYISMIKYYKKANTDNAYKSIGDYYKNIENDYEKMSEYYLLAVEKGNKYALEELDNCLINNNLSSISMMINYSLAIKMCNDVETLEQHGLKFQYFYSNYEKIMKIYYLSAIEKKSVLAMYEMGQYYQKINVNYEEMKKYYLMAIKQIDEYLIDIDTKYYMCNEELEDYTLNIKNNLSKLKLTVDDL